MNKNKNRNSTNKYFNRTTLVRWGILGAVTIIFTVLLYPNLVITKPQYNLGDVAERDIKAPRDFFVEDQATTEVQRQQAAEAVLTIYDFDPQLAEVLGAKVDQAFASTRALLNPPQSVAVQNSVIESETPINSPDESPMLTSIRSALFSLLIRNT